MTTIVNNKKIEFGPQNPCFSISIPIHIDDVEISFGFGNSMLNKKINVIFHGGPGEKSSWPITLDGLIQCHLTKLKLGSAGWLVEKIEIEPDEIGFEPIYFSLHKPEIFR